MSWANAMSGWSEAVSDEAEGLLLLFFLIFGVVAAAVVVVDLAVAASSADVSGLSISMMGAIILLIRFDISINFTSAAALNYFLRPSFCRGRFLAGGRAGSGSPR